MEATFFDEEIIKTNKTVSCPKCKTNHKIALNDCEVSCEICGELIEMEMSGSVNDFVWHPNISF